MIHTLIDSPLQSATLKPYLKAVKHTLEAAMCLENFSSQKVERHNKPEIEVSCSNNLCHICKMIISRFKNPQSCSLILLSFLGMRKRGYHSHTLNYLVNEFYL